jgi:GEVED domain/Domain of unknown function DUF11/Secretion system C-terminal sorting domain
MKRFLTLTFLWAFLSQILSAQCDLKLTVTTSNPTPNIYTEVIYTLTLLNEGPQTATNILVNAPEDLLTVAYGLVYTANVPSVGTWGIFGQQWQISSLASNASATLKLTLFTMQATPPKFFAQVAAATPFDLDSAPGNNTTKIVSEDDEVAIGGPIDLTPCDLDIQFTNVACIENTGFFFSVFNITVTTSNPDYEFVKLGLGSAFNTQIGAFNTPLTAPLSEFFLYSTDAPITITAQPINDNACVVSAIMPVLEGCGAPLPNECLFQYSSFDQVFCKNNNQNYGLVLDLIGEIGTNSSNLAATDTYIVYKDGIEVAQGVAGEINYIGLNDDLLFTGSANTFKVVRDVDQKCIFEQQVTSSNYCQEVPFNYCLQQAIFPWHEWIKRVQIDGIDKNSGKSTFSDFSTGAYNIGEQSAFIAVGTETPVTITVGYSFVAYDEYVRIWVDLDRNGTFEETEKLYEGILSGATSGANASGILNANINIPASAIEGVTRMKISMSRGSYPTNCESIPFGEVEYYSVNIMGGAPDPNQCNAFSFSIIGTECQDGGTPASPEDDVYFIRYLPVFPGYEGLEVFGFIVDPFSVPLPNGPNTINIGTIGQESLFGPLPISTFQSVNFSISPQSGLPNCFLPNQLVTAPASCSNNQPPTPTANCTVSSDYPWEDWISKVKIGNFEQTSTKSTYTDNTASTVNVTLGQTPISLTSAFSYFTFDEYWRIWIDFNHNGLFETPSEVAYEGINTKPINGVPSKTISGQINIPNTALPGMTHARVMMRRGAYGDPCGTIPYGEIEDYTINIAQGLQVGSNRNFEAVNNLLLENELQVYPNPAGEVLNVFLPKTAINAAKNGTITLYNHLGLEVLSDVFVKNAAAQTEILNLGELMNGQYTMKINIAGERPLFKKVVVSRMY